MFLSVLCFFSGVLFGQQWKQLPDDFILIFALIIAILMAYYNYRRIAYFLIGIVFASVFANHYLSQQLAPELQGKELLVQGHIIGLPEYTERRVRFDFQVTQSAVALPEQLRLSWYFPRKKLPLGKAGNFISN